MDNNKAVNSAVGDGQIQLLILVDRMNELKNDGKLGWGDEVTAEGVVISERGQNNKNVVSWSFGFSVIMCSFVLSPSL